MIELRLDDPHLVENFQAALDLKKMGFADDELQDVLCKFLRGRVDGDTLANIAEELADVGIMLDQMAIEFEVEDAVAEQRAHKVRRLRERMENDA